MKLFRIAEGPTQIGPGQIVSFDAEQYKPRAHRVRMIERAGDRFVVAANELLDLKQGEIVGFPEMPKHLAGKAQEIPGEAPSGRKTEEAVKHLGGDRKSKIIAAIGKLDPDNRRHYRSDGLPAVATLEKLLGFNITPAERDAAWKAMQAKK